MGRCPHIHLLSCEDDRNFWLDSFVGRAHRLVDMDVTTRNRSGGMAEHRRDRQLRIAQLARDATKSVPQGVGRYIRPTESVATSAQDTVGRNKVRLPAVRGEDIGAAFLNRLFRLEEQPSELKSLMRTSYAVFCFKKQKQNSH